MHPRYVKGPPGPPGPSNVRTYEVIVFSLAQACTQEEREVTFIQESITEASKDMVVSRIRNTGAGKLAILLDLSDINPQNVRVRVIVPTADSGVTTLPITIRKMDNSQDIYVVNTQIPTALVGYGKISVRLR